MVTPETLTDEMVDAIAIVECEQHLARDIATWKRCSRERRVSLPAAYRICEALNGKRP